MQDFHRVLVSETKNKAIPEEFNYFGRLVGSWQIDFTDHRDGCRIQGEWHFSWVLEGMAIQDVIILPDYEYGTSLHIYHPETHNWDVAYGYTGNIIQLEAKKQEDKIVLTFKEDENRMWMFTKIEDDKFHWQNVTVLANGEWQINAEIDAHRIA